MARSKGSSGRTPAATLASWLAWAALVVLIDQLTKALIVRGLRLGDRKAIVENWFDLTLAYNKGAAFSFLAGADGWQRWFFVAIAVAAAGFIVSLLARHGGQRLFAFGLASILGGAVGNLIDRILRGQVVDFLLAHHAGWYFPAFNVADASITLGAGVLILDELLRVRRGR